MYVLYSLSPLSSPSCLLLSYSPKKKITPGLPQTVREGMEQKGNPANRPMVDGGWAGIRVKIMLPGREEGGQEFAAEFLSEVKDSGREVAFYLCQ